MNLNLSLFWYEEKENWMIFRAANVSLVCKVYVGHEIYKFGRNQLGSF